MPKGQCFFHCKQKKEDRLSLLKSIVTSPISWEPKSLYNNTKKYYQFCFFKEKGSNNALQERQSTQPAGLVVVMSMPIGHWSQDY